MKRTKLILFVCAALYFVSACSFSGANEVSKDVDLPTELTYPKETIERPKIIALGDSLTAGFGLSEKESYPFLLQKRLENDGFNYEVVNAGVSGDTSLGGLERVDWVLGRDNIEILILELGANDLLRGIPVERMRKNLEAIIVKAKAKNVKILFCGMLAPEDRGRKYQRDYVNTFPELATKYDVAFLPFLLEGVAANRDLNQADGIHPNPKGTEIMTNNVYKELKPLLIKPSSKS